MRGQTKNPAQQATVERLVRKGWREDTMFALQVPMLFDRPFVGLPCPHVVYIDRAGKVHKGATIPRKK